KTDAYRGEVLRFSGCNSLQEAEKKAMETNSDGNLPEAWRSIPLGTVCEINPRGTLPKNIPDDYPVTFIPMAAIDERTGTIGQRLLRPFGEVRRGYTQFKEGDVLFAKITPCMQNGKHAIARDLSSEFGFGTTEFHVLRPSQEIISEWIHFFISQPEIL